MGDEVREVKTYLPLIMGSIAGIISFLITGNLRGRDGLAIIILFLFIYLHKFLIPKFGVEIEAKDWIGISFLTISSWYILWTILLNI